MLRGYFPWDPDSPEKLPCCTCSVCLLCIHFLFPGVPGCAGCVPSLACCWCCCCGGRVLLRILVCSFPHPGPGASKGSTTRGRTVWWTQWPRSAKKWSTNFDQSPHHTSCRYWGLIIISSAACCCWLNGFFAAYTAAETSGTFSGPDNPQKCLFPWGISTPSITWFHGPARLCLSTGTWYLDRSICSCTAHERDQQNW